MLVVALNLCQLANFTTLREQTLLLPFTGGIQVIISDCTGKTEILLSARAMGAYSIVVFTDRIGYCVFAVSRSSRNN